MGTATHINPSAKRIAAKELFDLPTLEKLRKRSDFIGFALIVHAWALIFAAMALFHFFPNPLTFLLAVMIIGARQLGLAVLMHDAAHLALFRTKSLNNWASDLFCGWPTLARTQSYRSYHMKHHARTQQPDDPDLILSKPFPITRKSLRRKMLRDLTGQTGFQQRRAQFANNFGPKELGLLGRIGYFLPRMGPALAVNAIIFAACAYLFHWSYYLMFWVLPFLTYHMAITRLRNIAEHAIVPDNDDPFRNARTTKANWLARLFLAPYWVNYHVEHHLLMHIPCYRLSAMHKALIANGFGPRMEMAPNYFDVLKRACARPNDEDRPGGIVHNSRRRVSGSFDKGFSANS